MTVSIFVHDLSSNPIVRASPIAKGVRHLGLDVEVLGLTINDERVYKPYRGEFSYITKESSSNILEVVRTARELAQEASGDIVYAFKPLWTSLWPALLASRFGNETPLLLDAEDHDLWLNTTFPLHRFLKIHLIDNWVDCGALRFKMLMHPFAKTIPSAVTVSTRALQKRYGGKILLHGPDINQFSPENVDESKKECRSLFNLPSSAPLALFAGTPHPHKGLDTVIKALQHDSAKSFHLVLAGAPDHSAFRRARRTLQDRCHLIGFVDNERMPKLLHAVDVIPIMQRENSYTKAQMPAKLLESMAMAKNVVVSSVGDLPRIIASDEGRMRGWVVNERDDQHLARVFQRIVDNPNDSKLRRERAKNFVQQEASVSAIADRLRPIMNRIVSADART